MSCFNYDSKTELKLTKTPRPSLWLAEGSVISQVKACHFDMASFVFVGYPPDNNVLLCFLEYSTLGGYFSYSLSLWILTI